jgi:hypothetical protein
MNKSQIIEAIQTRLGNGVLTSEVKKKFHENLIEKYTVPIYNDLLFNSFLSDNISLDGYTKRFWKVSVSKDADTNVYYSILPCKLASLPNAQDSVRQIYSNTLTFQPVSFDDLQTKSTLLVNSISTAIGYTLCLRDQSNAISETILDNENYIVEYDGMTTANAISEVSMRIVPAFDGFGDNDEVRLPIFKGVNLIDRVVQFFLTTPPKDLKFNNSDIK